LSQTYAQTLHTFNRIYVYQILITFNKLKIVSFVYYAKSKIGKRNNYLLGGFYVFSHPKLRKRNVYFTHTV